MLHLVIPAKNEAPYIADTLRRLSKSLSDLTIPWQIIVADNGSTDKTADAVEEFRTWNLELGNKISVIECPKTGKGAAIRYTALQLPITNYTPTLKELRGTGQIPMQEASGANLTTLDSEHGTSDHQSLVADLSESKFQVPGLPTEASAKEGSKSQSLFGFIDADLSADPDAIVGMVGRILEDKADIVIASRLLVTKTTNRSWMRTLSSKLFNFLADLFLNLKVADAQCGLKIMNAKGLKLIQSCQEEGWFLDIEFLAKARNAGLRIAEVPVPWLEFRYPNRSSQIHHLRDGIEAIRAIFRVRRLIRTSSFVHLTKN